MVDLLKHKYEALQEYCKIDSEEEENIYTIIRTTLNSFIDGCKNPAIWCYGKHTKMLMADFMFELKKVGYIIDNKIENMEDSGFEIIHEERIHEKKIDGVIISSYVYRDEIITRMKAKYEDVPYLDIYGELEKAGICLKENYYTKGSPYCRYDCINSLQRKLRQVEEIGVAVGILKDIIRVYIKIKDFQSAILYTKKLLVMLYSEWTESLLKQLEELYELQKKAMEKIGSNNVLMLCVDGLRRKDITEECVGKLYNFFKDTHYFCNAYSVSTSTFESLIPAYSENDDLRTKYYESDRVPENRCRFINEAKKQGRRIFFYTDGVSYIEDSRIKVMPRAMTATEKIWAFLLDALEEINGLFYVHVLYESHFSYPNPYTENRIVAEGTNILFDYLSKNGGRLRVDYEKQQRDALRYLDDVVFPLIKRLDCRMVLYADHGNIVLGRDTDIDSIDETMYSFHEDLIQVPIAIKSPEIEICRDEGLVSLMELNNIIISLMKKENVLIEKKRVIKVLRSEIYNPDFQYLYRNTGNDRGLMAFEVFIFDEGYKLAVFADGKVELYLAKSDKKIRDYLIMNRLLDEIRNSITVCDLKKICLI